MNLLEHLKIVVQIGNWLNWYLNTRLQQPIQQREDDLSVDYNGVRRDVTEGCSRKKFLKFLQKRQDV